MKYEEIYHLCGKIAESGRRRIYSDRRRGAYRKSCLYDDYGVDGKRGESITESTRTLTDWYI